MCGFHLPTPLTRAYPELVWTKTCRMFAIPAQAGIQTKKVKPVSLVYHSSNNLDYVPAHSAQSLRTLWFNSHCLTAKYTKDSQRSQRIRVLSGVPGKLQLVDGHTAWRDYLPSAAPFRSMEGNA